MTDLEVYNALLGETNIHWRVLYPHNFALDMEDLYVYCAIKDLGAVSCVPRYEFTFFLPGEGSFYTCKRPWSESFPTLFE